MRRLLFPGVLQGLLLMVVGTGTINALGHDADNVVVFALLSMVIIMIIQSIISNTETWEESSRETVAVAAVGIAVWIVAGVTSLL